MTLEQLRALVALSRAGSISKAARTLGMPRSTVARRLDELAAQADVRLWVNTAEGVLLTEAGASLTARATSLLADAEAVVRELRDAGQRTTLRVAHPPGLHPGLALAAVQTLLAIMPDLTIHAIPQSGGSNPEDVDLFVRFGGELPPGPFLVRSVTRAPVRLLASGAYIERHGRPTTVEELANHTLHVWSHDGQEVTHLPRRSGDPIAVVPRLVTMDLHVLHQLAHANAGIVWAIQGGLPTAAGRQPLVSVLDEVAVDLKVWIGVPEVARDAPRIREAIQRLLALKVLSHTAF
jgi:DNA-binding transcriptional LysR family regulator